MSNVIKIGNLTIDSFKVGAADCSIYLGTTKLYPQGEPPIPTGNVITYEAHSKLKEVSATTATTTNGLHTKRFYDSNNNVVSISSHTFANGVGTITFSGNIAKIGNYAFYGCSSLRGITYPSEVTSIGNYAFYNCHFNTNPITISSNITTIGEGAFSGASADYIEVESTTPATIGTNTFELYLGEYIPIIVPCESIDTYKSSWSAYADRICCNKGYNIYYTAQSRLHKKVTGHYGVDSMAFSGTNDQQLTLGGITNNYIIFDGEIKKIGINAFYSVDELYSIEIPSTVTSLGSGVFAGCSSLTSVTIPSSITEIPSSCFDNCNSLPSIELSDNITSIGYDAFDDCDSFTSVGGRGSGASVEIPSGVTSIADGTFSSCNILTAITIPNQITSIGDSAFRGCTSVQTLNIGSGLTSFTYNTFANTRNFEVISIDSNNTVYDSRNNCNAIIETSTNKLLIGCKNTVIPSSITSINGEAFQNCSGITSVTISDNITTIGQNAFANCSGLTSITCEGSTPPTLGNAAFYNTNDCPINVPAESVDAYKAAESWSDYASRIQAIP